MGLFEESTQLKPLGNGGYECNASEQWSIAGNVNGGWLMAVAARAALAELPHNDPLAVSAQYFAPVTEGPIGLKVVVLNRARSVSVAEVRVVQGDRLSCHFIVTATDFARVKGSSLEQRQPPILPPWEKCSTISSDIAPSIAQQVTMRYPDNMHWWEKTPGEATGYECWQAHSDEAELSALSLLLLVDAVPPAIFSTLGPIGWVPTVTLSVQLRGLPTGRRVKASVHSRSLRTGLAEEDVELWDENNQLLALSRQLLKTRA